LQESESWAETFLFRRTPSKSPLRFQFLELALLQGCVALLQLVPIRLKALKAKETDFEPQTVGDHIRKRRLLLKLTQKALASVLKVSQSSVINWERSNFQPTKASTLHRIIGFLGYDPLPKGQTIPERLRQKRRQMGWGQRELAEHFGVDRCTVTEWELGGTILKRSHRSMVVRFLGLAEANLTCEMGDRWNKNHGKRSARKP
jgi:transcriptional regulator with XRE-family HTH domain